MRPSHWSKNVFVFVALIFGGKLVGPIDEAVSAIAVSIGGFLCFSLAASAVYIFNDIIDRETDRLHPVKRNRPIVSGSVSVGSALVASLLCGVLSIAGSLVFAKGLAIVVGAYIALMVLYSLALKRMMILDCIVLSVGFCLRAIAGAIVVEVSISPWLIICTFAVCLFMAFGKRRSEMAQLGDEGEAFRNTLGGYTPELLAHMLDVTSGLAIVCFLLYAMDDRTLAIFGTNNLVYTTPFVLYCVFRFSALLQKGKFAGPVELTLKDLPFQIGFALWVLSCILIIYC
jgi:4-hydroxybenzoate polyprenyltransferase